VERLTGVNKLPELPNIVTRRLAERGPRPGTSHPDADLLTAFVEQTLPERDRGAVLGHLADCASCREIVALSQPAEAETGTLAIPKPTRSAGFSILRWGALAACAVLAVSVAVLHNRQTGEAAVGGEEPSFGGGVGAEVGAFGFRQGRLWESERG